MNMPKKTKKKTPTLETAEEKPVAVMPPQPTTFTADELLAIMPEPIIAPTQRQYGEDFYPQYERFYNKIRAAAK